MDIRKRAPNRAPAFRCRVCGADLSASLKRDGALASPSVREGGPLSLGGTDGAWTLTVTAAFSGDELLSATLDGEEISLIFRCVAEQKNDTDGTDGDNDGAADGELPPPDADPSASAPGNENENGAKNEGVLQQPADDNGKPPQPAGENGQESEQPAAGENGGAEANTVGLMTVDEDGTQRFHVPLGSVTVSVTASPKTFLPGSRLHVVAVPRENCATVVAAVESSRPGGATVALSYVFDITVLDADGHELQPAPGKQVRVSFSMEPVADANLDTRVYHVTEAGGALGRRAAGALHLQLPCRRRTLCGRGRPRGMRSFGA